METMRSRTESEFRRFAEIKYFGHQFVLLWPTRGGMHVIARRLGVAPGSSWFGAFISHAELGL